MSDVGQMRPGPGDNSINAAHLRAFVERIESLEASIRDLNDDKKEVYAECKGVGYDAKIIKRVVAIRRQDRLKRIEEETILDLYLSALGEA